MKWRKSSRSTSNGGACVEVAELSSTVYVRDSKNPDGPVLMFSSQEWKAFVEEAKRGEFDR